MFTIKIGIDDNIIGNYDVKLRKYVEFIIGEYYRTLDEVIPEVLCVEGYLEKDSRLEYIVTNCSNLKKSFTISLGLEKNISGDGIFLVFKVVPIEAGYIAEYIFSRTSSGVVAVTVPNLSCSDFSLLVRRKFKNIFNTFVLPNI